jgi:ATP-dependent Lhr-like helicase
MESAGRWALLERPGEPTADSRPDAAAIEHVARALLRRYGVVFHRILERESVPHPWRDLLRVFYRLEARGEVRGGRFVAGFAGQQFALSEAVTLLRSTRRRDKRGELVSMSAADPLNLVGLITPGERVPALTSNRICLRDGIPIACKVGDDVRFLIELEPPQRWEATSVLLRRTVPQQLKAYLGKSA